MKTETKTAKVYLRKWIFGNYSGDSKVEFELSLTEQESTEHFTYKYLCDVEVVIPTLSESDMNKIIHGAELESMIAQKEEFQAKTSATIAQMERRIKEMQCIEFQE